MSNEENVVFRIGGIELGLIFPDIFQFTSPGRFSDFISTNHPLAIYQIEDKPDNGAPAGSLIFDSGEIWRLFGSADRRTIWVGSRDLIPRLVGRFSPDYHRGEIFTTKNEFEIGKYYFPLAHPLGELLMTNLLGSGYGLMLHSCGVIDGESGLVFAGSSSAGKTTTARLWYNNSGVRVVNDDHVILRKINGKFRLYGTPWHGEGGYTLAQDAPLQKIFLLEHAQFNQAVLLSPAQAAAAILVRSFPPLWDASAMAFTLQFLDELCQTVPCYKFGFIPDQSAVEYVRCLT